MRGVVEWVEMVKSMGLAKTGGVFLIPFHNHHAILGNGH